MSRLIDADALVAELENVLWDWDSVNGITATTVLKQTISDIKNAPTIDAEPEGCPFYIKNIHDRGDDSLCRLFHREVKCLAVETRQVGRWIDDNCSVCGFYVYHGDARNFCPNCGAKMEADNET